MHIIHKQRQLHVTVMTLDDIKIRMNHAMNKLQTNSQAIGSEEYLLFADGGGLLNGTKTS